MSQEEHPLKGMQPSFAGIAMCFLGAVFYCYEYFLRVAPSVMKPELTTSFHLTGAGFGVLAGFYYYAYTPAQLGVGLVMDKYGPRRILTGACLFCAVGTYIFGATNQLWIAKLGRALVGFGSAFAYVGVLKLASIWLPPRFFAAMAGFCTALGKLGAVSGQNIMTYFVAKIGWRQTNYWSAFVGIILMFVLWFFIRDKMESDVRDERKKFAPSSENITSLHDMWLNFKEVAKNKHIWCAGTIGFLMYLPITVFAENWGISFLKSMGYSKTLAPLGSTLIFLGFAIGSPIWGFMSDKIASRRWPIIIGSLVALVFVCLWIMLPGSPMLLLFAFFIMSGVFGGSQVLVFAVANDVSRHGVSATAVSFTNMLIMAGGAIMVPLVGNLLDYFSLQDASYVTGGLPGILSYQKALLMIPAGLILTAFVAFFMPESHHKKRKLSN